MVMPGNVQLVLHGVHAASADKGEVPNWTVESVEAPAMLIIGEVAAFSDKLAWFEPARSLAEAP